MELNDLAAFISVARAGGFRDAARISGVSASSLSIAVQRLETKLGLRLLNRTTRSVAPTEAGERLLIRVGPRLDEIETELAALSALRDRPAGTIRLTSVEYAADEILLPKLAKLLPAYPDLKVEIESLTVEDAMKAASFLAECSAAQVHGMSSLRREAGHRLRSLVSAHR